MRNRGQLDQPFIYIFAIIVIAFILLFGLRYIGKTKEFNDKAIYLNFKSSLQDAVTSAYNKNPETFLTFSQSSANKPLSLPEEIKEICFQQSNGKTKIIPDSKIYQEFTINSLSPSTTNLCIKTYGGLSFRLENKIINKQTIVIIDHA